MKKIHFLIVATFVAGISYSAFAQNVHLKSGSLAGLKGVNEIRVEYTYDNMKVGKYKETDYVEKKVKEYNKKEPGRGDQWKEDWVNDRTSKFEPRFQQGFNNLFHLFL